MMLKPGDARWMILSSCGISPGSSDAWLSVKQLLITRGAIPTFSVANDVAKYFAIIPAAFVATYPELGALNIIHLATPESAIVSAVIFNALIIIGLVHEPR
jgi:high-affinity K+ transport system ATPase subunit B